MISVVAAAAWASLAMRQLDIDAFPDTTPVQVQINTVAPSLGPEEVEQQITFPIEQSLSGLPKIQQMRSISKFGLSQVVLIFEEFGTGYLLCSGNWSTNGSRRCNCRKAWTWPKMGPVSTGLGEVFHYVVTGKGDT